MVKHVQLNNVDHQDLRIKMERSRELGDDVMHCATYAFEFRNVQAHYPIVFHKDPTTGRYQAVALFGFEQGQNLFLSEEGWDAHYIPMIMQMQPFLIGYRQGGDASQTEIHIDIDNPRCSLTEGTPVFLENGGQSDFLKHIAEILNTVHHAHQTNHAFMEALTALNLLEPFALDIELNDGSKNRLAGFHIINEEILYALDADQLGGLQRMNFLQPIYMAVASMSHFRDLIERKNKRLEIM